MKQLFVIPFFLLAPPAFAEDAQDTSRPTHPPVVTSSFPPPVLSRQTPEERIKNSSADTTIYGAIGGPCSYIVDAQRRIKRNWLPPRLPGNQTVKVRFSIYRDGQIKEALVTATSGDAVADAAALTAVTSTPCLRALPGGAPDKVDVEMTFSRRASDQGVKGLFIPDKPSG